MRDFFISLFRDDTFGPQMGVFNLTHILVLFLFISITVLLSFYLKTKDSTYKKKFLDVLSIVIVCLYFGDFFIHPLMNNENALIVDKLPFHLCTSASILIFLGRIFRDKFEKIYHAPVVLGMIGALLYIMVPTGISDTYLFCYRTLQTLIYHCLLLLFGILSIVLEDIQLSFKTIYIEAIMVSIQIGISLFANEIYSTDDHLYNWYFTKSFMGVPDALMPFVMFGLLMLLSAIIFLIDYLAHKKRKT